jgi:trehalose utilization protein
MIKVTVWNEFVHERSDAAVKAIYPDGIHNAVKAFLDADGEFSVRAVYLDQPEHGLTDEVLDDTDVIIWWGHMAHHKVSDEVARKVSDRILMGMGAIFLHSAHMAKPFLNILGTSGCLSWREAGESERLWCVNPAHPINAGLPAYFEIPREETYGEFFDIPKPDDLVYIGWYSGGDVFRSGCCWHRGYGKVFYFQPGHESFPIYHMPEVQAVIKNAVKWARSDTKINELTCPNVTVSPQEQLAAGANV